MERISAINTEKAIAACVKIIHEGGVVAFPTETFYGLGVKYDDPAALTKLSALKHRPEDKALPLIIGDRKALALIARPAGPLAEKLMDRFWPGPLTLLIAAKEGLPESLTGGSGKVAVRIPGESFALELARALDFPITSTSANVSGMPPAYRPEGVIRYFGDKIDILVDGGETPGGKPSTIADITADKIKIMRKGAIPEEEIYDLLGAYQGK